MHELTFILDDLSGELVVEDNEYLNRGILQILQNHLGEAQEIACARPIEILSPPTAAIKDLDESQSVRIAGYYHNSLTEGPGRRSSVNPGFKTSRGERSGSNLTRSDSPDIVCRYHRAEPIYHPRRKTTDR